MTKSDLFKRAHLIARMTKDAAGSYQIAFSVALKALYAGEYASFEAMAESLRGTLEAAGANWHLCRNLRDNVIYFNDCAKNLGYADAAKVAGKSIRVGEAPSKDVCRFIIWAYASKGTLCNARRPRRTACYDIEDILSLGGGEEVYARMTR